MNAAPVARTVREAEEWGPGDVRIPYRSQGEYEDATGALGMLQEWKDGVPRAAYQGVVSLCTHAVLSAQSLSKASVQTAVSVRRASQIKTIVLLAAWSGEVNRKGSKGGSSSD